MARIKTWEISDAFWALIQPHVPLKERPADKVYRRKPGGGRKSAPPQYFRGHRLRVAHRNHLERLAREKFGVCSSTVHRVFLEWQKAGFFLELWRAGLAEYDEMEGIAWEWQATDGTMVKAPLAQESVGPNPTDRGKKWEQASSAGRRAWRPAGNRRQRGQLQ
jgi:transposase